MIGDGYVKDVDLTVEYIDSLLARCVGWSNVTADYPDYVDQYGALYVIQDPNGGIDIITSLIGMRNIMINAYVIQQNS